jgi:hypothetical protein
MLPYSESLAQAGLDDIKYSCKKTKFSSSGGAACALVRQLDGSLVATSTRTSATTAGSTSTHQRMLMGRKREQVPFKLRQIFGKKEPTDRVASRPSIRLPGDL